MNITIKEQDVSLKWSFRALMIYEQIMNKSFNPQGLTDIITFFYCVILGSKKDIELTYDEFLDWIDENPGILKEFSEWIVRITELNNSLMKSVPEEEKKKLKKVKDKKNF